MPIQQWQAGVDLILQVSACCEWQFINSNTCRPTPFFAARLGHSISGTLSLLKSACLICDTERW